MLITIGNNRLGEPNSYLAWVLAAFLSIATGVSASADTPNLSAAPPTEAFVGEEFCFDAGLTNTGSTGFGPYYQIITKPDYTLASADFIGLMLSPATVGTFPAAPGNQLTDPVSGLDVTGPEGGTLYTASYPVGSVVTGQPSLEMELCIDVDAAATIDVLETDAFELIPGYEFGDTPTGDNGTTVGTRTDFDFTPRVITYQISDILAEMENPPGPAWTWDIEVVADIAADRTVTPIDFSTVSPIVLPANVQFVGPVTFTGSGVTCTATSPVAPPPENPGGSVDLDCVSGTGTPGNDEDIVVTFPVYIVDTLDEGTCGTAGAINTAKHVTLRKTSTGGAFPGGSVTYTLAFQVSEFVDGIDSLSLVDVMPDGLTFVNSPTVTYNGGGATAITPTVANNIPGAGETTVTYDVTGVTGALLPATSGFITYSTTIDQTYAGGALAGQPVRARDDLANSVIGTYDITNGANACSDDSAETITIPDVSSSKSLIGSANVQPGDSVTWRLQLDVPSGDVQGIEFNDYFPLPVFDVSTIDTNTNIAANTDLSFGPNDTLGANPLSITAVPAENRLAIVWPDVISAMGETIEVDVAVVVSNEPFADGLVLSNLFQAITDNSAVDNGDALNIDDITLQQPELALSKTATTADSGLEAGDSVSFDIVISNDGSAEAYDVTVADTLPTSLTSCVVDSVTGGTGAGDIFGAGFTFATFTGVTGNALDPADSATIAITCDIASTAANNESIDNDVSVVWATQPGATLFPAETAQATVSTSQAQAFKEIVNTSEASTAEGTADTNGDPRPVATGEVIRYRTWFYIPQGTLSSVSVRDLLPTGLAHIADSETLVGLVSDSGANLASSTLACATGTAPRAGNDATDLSTLALDCTLAIAGTGGSGQDPVLSLGTLTNSEDDANEELVVLELNARVVGDVATGTNMNNRARLQTSNGNATSGGVFVQQTNPAIDITKTVMPSTADAEDTVEYVITVEHNATDSTADAFDISFTDVIQAGLTYDSGTGVTGPQAPTVADTCTAASIVVDDADPAGAGIVITFDGLPQGETCEVRYFAETAAGVVPGQTIDNTVNLGYSSLPGNGTDPNPTGSTPGAEAAFVGSAMATLTIDSVEIEKSIAGTDFAHTSDASAGTALDPREVAVGEALTYRLQMRLPEGTASNYEITDLLPTGLAYVASSARIAFVFDGGGSITPTPGIVCGGGTLNQVGNEGSVDGITPTCGLEPTGAPFNSGTDPVWDLGDLVNTDMDANQEFVIVEFDARVQNETGNQDGDTLSNTYELSVDGDVVASTAVVAQVIEPQLTLAAAATPNPVDNRVDTTPTVSWDITLANAGNATAFQIDADSGGGWEIVLPTGIDNITSLTLTPTGSVFNNGTAVPVVVGDVTIGTTNNTNDTLTFANPFQMAPGSSLLVEFDADLLASVLPGDTPSGIDDVVYAGNDTGSTATGIRDDASLANGTGNTPITDTTDLDDYRTEVTLSVATVAENPALTVGKTITAGPVNLGTGSFTLTYTVALENTGDVGLDTIAIEDNLDTTFGAGNYIVDDVRVTSDSTTLAEDVAFTGAPATIELLLPGTSTLPVGESGAIEIDLTVTPAGGLGPFTNTAVGTSASDRTGNAANDNGAVDVTFDDGGELGLAKRVSAGPTNNSDGTYTLDFEFLIDNSGLVVLDNILLDDDLATTFADATSFAVDSVTSADFTVNFPGFDGDADTALLDGSDTLAAGTDGTVTVTVTVTPGADLGPYENFAIVQADTPTGTTLSDQSEDGVNPDGNSNGDPTDDADLTIVTFAEDPDIGAAKEVSAGPTNNGDGTFTLTYSIVLENVGDVPLVGVQATDNLQATFAGATSFTVDNVTSADFSVNFPGFTGTGAGSTSLLDGTDGLAVGASGSIDLIVTVTPGANLGPYNNQATGSAEGPGGSNASDVSDNGSDPDGNGNGDPSDDNDVTPVTFTEIAEIGVAKAVAAGSPTNNGDGTFTLTYDILVENSGDVQLSVVQVTDDLATAFAGATSFTVDNVVSADFAVNFPGFNGDADQNLVAGTDTLNAGATGTINLTVTVTPGANLGPFNNSADASGDSPGGATVGDASDSGTDPDGNGNGDPTDDSDPTPVTFTENPEIGLAKAIQGAVTNNGDGTYELTYRFAAENSGDTSLANVQITDDLATAFAGATFTVDAVASTDFTVNFPGFDGDGDQDLLAAGNTLAVATSGSVDVTVTVTPGANLGPYNNTANASGSAPGGGVVNDTSDEGTDPDGNGNGDPTDDSTVTPVTFTESPEVGLAKEIPAAPTNNLDGSFTLTYRLFLENSGDVPVNGVQIADDLATVFADAASFTVDSVTSADFTVNFPGFNGGADTDLLDGTDNLAVAASGTVDVTVTVTPGVDLGPYDNTADASGTSAGGAPVADTSHLGTDPDGNGNGDPTDDSDVTPVTFVEGPAIAVVKTVLVAPANNADGTYSLTYRLALSNSGDTPLNDVQVSDDLEAVFGVGTVVVDSVTALTLSENASFDGTTAGDVDLLDGTDSLAVGASADIDLAITVTPGASLGPFVNSATASGTSPGNQAVNSPGNAPNVSFAEAPEIGVAKQLTAAPTNNGDGTYTLSYLITVENSGDVALSAVQVDEDLAITFALAGSFSVDSVVASAGLTAAPGFNGDAATGQLVGTDVLAAAQSETITLTVTVTPAGVLGPYNNTVVANGTSPSGAASTDNSTDGVDPDTNGNGDPTDDSVPTVVTFAEAPEIGLAKALVSGPTNNSDGTYTLGYQFIVENSGDVVVTNLQVTDDLATTFAGATFTVDSLTSADVTVNAAGFNGAGDANLLAGTDSLAVGASATVALTVTVTPGANLGPYDNTADASGTSPTGAAVTDTSDDGADPDGNGNGDPTDDSDVTSVTFTEAPELGLAKALVTGPTNNSDGTYTLGYQFVVENSGDVTVSNVQITDDLTVTFAGATFVVDALTSGDVIVNAAGFDGAGDTNLLAGSDSLAVGANATVDLTITVTPGANLGPYDNTADASGTSPTNAVVTDTSNDGADPDGNGNGDPTDDSDVTPVTFTEAPVLGLAKALVTGPTNNSDGTYTLGYQFIVENSGDVAISNVQITDDLAVTFAGATFVVDALTSGDVIVNAAGFDGAGDTNLLAGSDSLAVGASATVDLTVTVTPGANLGPYDNTADASGNSPANAVVTDTSDDGADPDGNGNGDPTDDSDVTPVTFTEAPVLGLAKEVSAGPTNNGDGTYTLGYRFAVENSGDVVVDNLQIVDDLAATFAGATSFTVDAVSSASLAVNFPGFDGGADTSLLVGSESLAVGASATVDVTVTVTPGADLGPYDNTAVANGESPTGAPVSDVSDSGADPDGNGNGDPSDDSDVTSTTFVEAPQIGVAKQVTSGPVNNADGTHTLTYTFLVENTGDVALSAVQVSDDLAATFAGAASFTADTLTSADFTVAPGYDGNANTDLLAGTDALAVAASGSIELVVTVTPGGNLGPYANSATASGTSPANAPVSDLSDDAANVDENGNGDPGDDSDSTDVTFTENPVIGLAKALLSGPDNNGDGSYTLTYQFVVSNGGDVDLSSVNIVEDLAAVFAAADSFSVDSVTSATLSPQAGFDGSANTDLLDGTDSLAVGAQATVDLAITVVSGADLGPYQNAAVATGDSPSGQPTTDDSVAGADPDANGNGDPTDDSSPVDVTFAENPQLGLAKTATLSTPNFDGTFTTTIELTVVNSGDVEIRNLIVADDLQTNLAPATVESIANVVVAGSLSALNPNFDGIVDPNITDGSESLAPGESAVITFDVTFNGNGNVGPFSNLANTAGESPGNPNPGQPNVEDDSTQGNDPDANGNGDPTDDTTPTVIEFNPGVDGTVDITDESVPGDLLDVTVTDSDENMDSAVVESFDVTVVNDQTGESEVITVVETGPDTGVFTAQVPTTFAPNAGANDDGTLVTRPEDTVTVLYEDRLTSVGDVQTRTDTGVVIGLATIEGNAWLDSDTDDVFDPGETPLDGWIIRVERDGVFVAEVPVNPDGSYSIAELLPGAGYSVALIHPDSGVTFGVLEDLDLPPETVVLEQNLPIDPTGVFYDSVERAPVEGVITTIVNSAGTPLPDACLLPNQQDQTSAADGLYRFDLILGAAPACPSGETFTLVYQVPAEFNPGISALLPPIGGALDPTGLGDPVRVAPQLGAPSLNESTDYYLAFTLDNGDPDIVFNHIPLDPVGVGGFTVRLTKDVNQPTATVGSLVSYTITLENLSTVTLPGVSVVDSLPPGFSYVEDSAILDDGTDALIVSGTRPVTFAGINLAPDTRRVLRYVLRTGAGVTRGEYVNTAEPFIGPAPIGNRDSAEVVVIADPDFEETTVIGKVWNDRDEDGWQDIALATQLEVSVRLSSGGVGRNTLVRHGNAPAQATNSSMADGGVTVAELPGLYGDADLREANRVVLRERFNSPVSVREVEIRTKEGSVIKLDELGNVSDDHRGQVRRGENSQSLQASYRVTEVDGGFELRVEVINTGMDEPGIPGVRLATVEGLLIETDAYGRYHIAGVDGGFFERGRNFIVKVDAETLPSETTFTTENPRVKRISQGLMNRFDFGVHLPESAPLEQRFTVKIAEMFFIPGSATVEPGYIAALRDLADKLASGAFVTLSIEAFADPAQSGSSAARDLAERRAQALIDALCELAGRDVSENIDVTIAPALSVGRVSQEGSAVSIKQWLSGLLMAVSSVAWADDHGSGCNALDDCRTADGVPVIVVEQHSPSVYEPSAELPDQGRVDLYGKTVQRLVDGGVIWLTEDPAALTPQLAIEGPSHLPLRNGQIDGDQEFVIYTNYAAFIESLELRIYRDRDVDRRDPVAVMAVDTSADKRNLYRLSWPVDGDSNLADGSANALGVSGLNYELIATSANGERDRTAVKRMFFIDADLYDTHQEKNNRFGDSLVPEVVLREAEDGIVVFLPPVSGSEAAQTLRFTFAELSAELSDSDKAMLARELDQLAGNQLVRIRADGHTSSLGIAARSRKVFADNYALSKARAQSVVDFARSHLGSFDAAVEANGFGPKQPLASNATATGRAQNRRVETLLATQSEGDSSKVVVVDRVTGLAADYLPRTATSLADSDTGRAQDPALRAMGRNDLAIQRIPVYGSRIRLQGTDLGEDYRAWLNGEPVYIDDSRAFAYEYLLPIGEHQFDLIVANSSRVVVERTMPVLIDGRYHFMVALADFTASDNDISGSLEALSGDDRYGEDMLVEGRLAFYLKGKVKGKYLITAQLDTREEEIDDLFSKIHEKDPDSLFRRLDPDRYYPVYGDDSTTVADTNSHGRMYLRVDWDRSQALWGNFDTGLTGNELIQYSRGLYGARLSYESLAATEHDDTRTLANGFVSEGQTALGHSEFLGTGGSLYYFRHTDILPGSDKLRIEIRDPDTNRVIDNQLLAREVDYEIDEIQGRVILSKPLLQVSTQSAPSLINDGPIDGNVTILVADYEYVPDGFDANNVTAGARVKHWFNDSIAVGGTYVEEGRSDEDYRLGGVDITLKPKQDTYLKVEWASSEATQTSRFFSTDGGLSFANSTPTGQGDRAGDAWGVDLHINAGDYGGNPEWVSNLWFRDVDDQYSVARRDDGNNTQEYGFETQLPISDSWLIGLRASRVDVQDQFELTEIGLQSDWRIGERGVLASELKHVDQRRTGQADADALLAGLQYEHRLTNRLTMFGGGQVTVDQSGPYDNNDAVNLGAKLAISSDTNAEVELRDGHRGSGGVATLEHALNSKHTVYGTVTHSTDTTNDPFARSDNGASMLDNVGTNFAVGHRWRLNDRTLIFTEGQHSRGPDYSGVGEVFGIDYAMKSGWHLGFTAQDGEITGNNGLVDRQSLTVSTGYQSRRVNFSSRLEHRDDSGAEDVVQWLTTNRLDFKINETYRLATKLNWSDSDSDFGSDEDAKLVEGSIGLARRPVDTNRFNWLAKYTYLYDLQSFGQEDSETDQRSHVMSWEGIYRLNRQFDLGGKVARRESELRLGRNNGPWFESTANFASTRLRWHVIHNWDGMLEYRWLEVEEASNERAGFLATISRHIGEHFKVGVGYNFTDFSDDLTDLDYDHKGFFLNVVGKY